jgi:predicted lipoprotein with Yx(FWY)xxD motif
MKRRLPTLGVLLASAIALAACGSSTTGGGTSTASPTPTTTSTGVAGSAATSVIVTQNQTLGAILTDPSGHTLYYFVPERGGKIVCISNCLQTWPPFYSSSVSAGPGVTGKVSIERRPEGSQQVTYNSWPLYYFAKDTAPGQANGQHVNGFGGEWIVATPSLQP